MYFIALFTIITTGLTAQYAIDWIADADNYNKTAVMGATDSQQNLIVAGYWQSYSMFTRKINPEGNLLWEAEDASGINDLYEKAYWINCDIHDNVYVVGKRYSIASGWEYPDAIVALKYSPDGNLLWKQLIPVQMLIGSQHPGFNVRSEVDANENLYIGSYADDPAGVIFAKIDAGGALLFTQTSTLNAPRGFRSMRLRGNELLMATGSASSQTAPVYVWNTDGTLQWTAAASGNGTFDIESDENDNIYALSYLNNAVSPSSGDDISITKFSSEGTLLWKKDYDHGGTEFPTRFVYANNRLTAISYGSSTPGAYFDWKTFQLDTNGTLLWTAVYNGTPGNDEIPYSITSLPSGDLIVTGKGGPSPDPNNLSYLQMVIIQYSATGVQTWIDTPNIYGGWGIASFFASDNSLYAISSSNMSVYHYLPDQATTIQRPDISEKLQLYPNPFAEHAYLHLTLQKAGNCMLQLIRTDGKIVRQQSYTSLDIGEHTFEIDGTELLPGIYLYQLTTTDHVLTGRLVKR